MWTSKNRGRYDRSALRYPSDLTDDEWALNGIMYVLSMGCQWRAIPKDLPPRSTVHDYLDLWRTARSIAFITRFTWSAVSEAAGLGSAAGTAERRQGQRHDHAQGQAPAASDGKAHRKRERTLDLFR